jgi:pyruvate/oxaloacetate carboxyltransferase
MHIRMSNLERLTVAEMEEFVSSNRGIDCSVIEGAAAYGFIERVLTAQRYRKLSKGQRGIVGGSWGRSPG